MRSENELVKHPCKKRISFEEWVLKKETEQKLREKLISQARLSMGLYEQALLPGTPAEDSKSATDRMALRESEEFRELQVELQEKQREDLQKDAEKRRRYQKWHADKERERRKKQNEQRQKELRDERIQKRKDMHAESTYKEWLKRNLEKLKSEKAA